MLTRHSWQMPMPHSGARGMPLTERRVMPGAAAAASAAATLQPAATLTLLPLIFISI
jgi:hypothetical protein